jgi:short-subunit dehydrogenase
MNNKIKNILHANYGPWAVVTGASSGIGRESALILAEAGLALVLVARRQEALEQLAREIGDQYGTQTLIVKADLSGEEGIRAVRQATEDLEVGLLFAAAGYGTTGSFLDNPIAQELNMLNLNIRAVLELSWYFGRRFAARGRGGIVLVGSIVGFQGMPNSANYAATKAYVQSLGEALTIELAPYGVDVLTSAPGPTNSGFAERAGQKMGAALAAATVAEKTLAALGKKGTVLPGSLSKLLVYSLALLPRQLRVRIMGQVMHGMIKHRRTESQFAKAQVQR